MYKNNDIEELARKKRNEYQRKWREENKDKVRQYNKNYWKNRVKDELAAEKEAK